ncbi:MAG: DUF1501 domain-containing protein [Myxococcales bacterium]|nr:DUF1501 domain-containing protein [Myxococcales bacterium]
MDRKNDRKSLSRRQMLKASAATLACASLPGGWAPARAQSSSAARKLIVVLNNGGWDPTYALDPKPGSSIVDTPEGEIRQFGNHAVLTNATRPAVDDFFTRYGDITAVVNGLQVRSFVHTDCIKRILTGSPSETTPDLGAITAFELGRELPVPYLALGGQARGGPLAAITGRTGTTNQLAALIDPAAGYPRPGGVLPEIGLVPSDGEQALVREYLDASAARLQATRGARGYNRRRVEDFMSSLQRAEQLRAFARTSSVGERDYTQDLQIQIPLAVRALGEGLSCTTLLQTDDWDTHDDNSEQDMLHQGLFASLITLVESLEQAQLLDETMVLVISEMGRTPRLNNDGGKDHWPVTSAMLLGAGVGGNRTLGGTSDSFDALSVDLATGETASDGNQLQAANFVAGVLEAQGVDPAAYLPQVEPFRGFVA